MGALVLLLATGCGHGEVRRLRIGMNPWPGYTHMVVAKEQRLFEAHGIDAQIVEYTSLHDLRRGYAEGQIDVLPSTLLEVLMLAEPRAKAPVVVWVADASNGGDVVVARNVADVKALRGRKIAYEAGTVAVYMLTRFLAKNELTQESVHAVAMDQGRMADAMARGEIDAALTYQPFTGQMLAQPDTRVLFTSREIPGEVIDTISIDGCLVDADPTLVARFQSAMADTHRFCQQNPAVAEGILARVTGVQREELREALASVLVYSPADQYAWLAGSSRLQGLATAIAGVLGTPAPPVRLATAALLAPELIPASPR